MASIEAMRKRHIEADVREDQDRNQINTRFALVLWLFVCAWLLTQNDMFTPNRTFLAWEALLVFLSAMFLIGRTAIDGFWSPASIFLLVTGIFHLGLVGHMIAGIEPVLLQRDWQWYDGPIGLESLQIVIAGIASYTLATLLIFSFARRTDPSSRDPRYDVLLRRLSAVGAIILLGSVLLWFTYVATTVGLGAIFGTYEHFLAATTDKVNLNIPYAGMALGLGLTFVVPLRFIGWLAFSSFVVFASAGFFLGLRGEVLFTLAAAIPVLAARRRMPSAWLAILLAVGVLVLINIAKVVRSVGVSTTTLTQITASPLDALAEMGSSIRVVATVIRWHDSGEPFYNGDTYIVAIARFFEQFSPLGRLEAEADYRLFNVEIGAREGPIGGSIIAEAFHNFGTVGVVLVLGLVGLLFAYFSRAHRSPMALATYVALAAPLFNHVRNSFVGVIPYVLAGFAVVLIVRALTRVRPSKERADLI